MAQLSLLVPPMDSLFDKLLVQLSLKKAQYPPLGTVEVVIDPDTEVQQNFTLYPQKEPQLIPLTPGRHVVAVLDPEREKHLETTVKGNSIMSGLGGVALGAALGGSQDAMDLAAKGFSKVFVGDPVKRWEKAFEKRSVKVIDIQEGETVGFRCALSKEEGIVSLVKRRV